MSDYYTVSGSPSTGAAGASSPIRSEFTSISAGFDKLPALNNAGNQAVFVNAGGTALESVNNTTARTRLGAQAQDADLDALAALDATVGFLVKTAAATFNRNVITGTANEITVTNGNGVAGNATFSLPTALTFTGKTVTGGTFNNVAVPLIYGDVAVRGTTVPVNSQSANYTTVIGDANGYLLHPAADNNVRVFTLANNATVPYTRGTYILVANLSPQPLTLAINSDTMILEGTASTGNRTVTGNSVATLFKADNTIWLASGAGVS